MLALALAACSSRQAPPATESSIQEVPSLASLGQDNSDISVSCVLYARAASGIDLRGDAYAWWDAAAGRYLRGQEPEVGAVLVLSQSDRLQRGHLAVVRQIVDPRDILVDHANWVPGKIITGMAVRDVSPANDWTELRFLNPDYNVFGAIYPASGFIYQMPPGPATSASSTQGTTQGTIGGTTSGELRPQVAAQ